MNESNTIFDGSIPNLHHKNKRNSLTSKLSQCFKRPRREKTREEATTATDRGRENADPASGDGAGAGEKSCAETVVAAEKIAAAKKSTKAFSIAIDAGKNEIEN